MHPTLKPYCFFYYPFDLLLTGASGCESSAAAEKYVIRGIGVVQMFKAFPLRGVELLPAIVRAQAGLGFPPQAPSAETVKVQNERTEVGGGGGGIRLGLCPLPGGSWVVVLVYCLSVLLFIKLWGQM